MKMKTAILGSIALILWCALWLNAANVTRIALGLLFGPTSTSGFAMVVLPNGNVSQATLSGLTLNTTTNPPTLSAAQQSSKTPITSNVVVTTPSQTWPTPASSCTLLSVYLDGLLLSSGNDYTVATGGSAITINSATWTLVAGDIIQQTCYQ